MLPALSIDCFLWITLLSQPWMILFAGLSDNVLNKACMWILQLRCHASYITMTMTVKMIKTALQLKQYIIFNRIINVS